MTIKYPFSLGKNFEKIIEKQLKKPEIAILELLSNSWNANAKNVYIEWPIIKNLRETNEYFTILDDGEGMDKTEFIEKWTTVGYDKRKNITNTEMKTEDNRDMIGKNGRGRLGLFSFSDTYTISTSKNKQINSFKITRNDKTFATLNEINTIEKPFKNSEGSYNNGLYIKCPINNQYVEINDLKEIINIRFGADPNFNIYINNEKIDLFDFKDNFEYKEIFYENDPNKSIKIYSIPKDQYNKKLSTYELVWWVKNRYVEQDKWKDIGIKLDSRNSNENKYTFLICTDFLENHVKSDGTGFKDDDIINDVKKVISDEINDMMSNIISTNKKERKKSILMKTKNNIKNLTPIEQHEVGKYLEEIIETCNHLSNKDFSNILKVMAKMELSNRKYDFFEKIVNVTPDEIDKLTEIVEKWSIDDAYLVLNELYKRLELINKIDSLIDDPKTKEVQQLQPLFKEGLWIFHPKYEGTTRFTSNQSMNKVMSELLGVENYHSENAQKRPDFIVLEDSTISTYTSDYYKENSEVIEGYDEVLIIELKRGDSKIGSDEKYQALKYAKEIKQKGPAIKNITAYVLGSNIDPNELESTTEGNITINPRQYYSVIKTAKNRTFNLIDKIKNVKGITQIGDSEINEVLKEDKTQSNF